MHSQLEKSPCPICFDFQGTKPFWHSRAEAIAADDVRHHFKQAFTWADLEGSSRICHCCNVLLQGCRGCFLQHGVEETAIVSASIRFYYHSFKSEEDPATSDTDKELRFHLKGGEEFEIQIFAHEAEEYPIPDAWESIPVFGRTSPGTSSEDALDIAQAWVEECVNGHKCRLNKDEKLPTRLVDVGLRDGVIKVIETQGRSGQYVCLSHCWGRAQIITTTKATYEDRKQQISLKALSQTFRDAVALTRRLGIPYIWIDSLCILQDDLEDWETESAQMASVYSNAYLTIAATKSASGAGGLFVSTPDTMVSGTTPEGEDYSVFFRRKIEHHLEVVGSDSGAFLDSGNATVTYHPLLTRAWVYQERLLSTRMLHFGPYELFYECDEEVQCECGGIAYQGSSNTSPATAVKLMYGDAMTTFFEDGDEDGLDWAEENQDYIARTWRTMISSYTALDLTVASDRLPAVGGVARQMSERRDGSRYLAGLWENSLNDDLLWIINATALKKRPRPEGPRNAPTWSWASVETFALYSDAFLYWEPDLLIDEPQRPYEHFSRVESCIVTPKSIDKFGSLTEGLLTITGLVAEGQLIRELAAIGNSKPTIQHYIYFPHTELEPLRINADYLLDADGPYQTLPGTQVFCLRMSKFEEGRTEVLESLVLKRSTFMPDAYERIGTLSIVARPPPVDPLGGIYDVHGERTIVII